MTQAEFNQMLQTAIAGSAAGGYYTSKWSGEEIDRMLGTGNLNLLDNWYFPDPINQRRIVSGAAISAGYFLDRWYNIGNTESAWIDGEGIKFAGLSSNVVMEQQLERGWIPDGTVVTASMLYKIEGETTLRLVSVTGSLGGSAFSETVNGVAVKLDLKSATGNPMVRIYVYTGHPTVVVKAAKLELGAQQTLARKDAAENWVLNDPPPNNALELEKCQRYQISLLGKDLSWVVLGNGQATSQTSATIVVPVPTTLRTRPTLSWLGTYHLRGLNTAIEITDMIVDAYTNSAVKLIVNNTGPLTVGQSLILMKGAAETTQKFLLDANL